VRLAKESIMSGNARKELDGFVEGTAQVAKTVSLHRGHEQLS
jgi:hypothetical protein